MRASLFAVNSTCEGGCISQQSQRLTSELLPGTASEADDAGSDWSLYDYPTLYDRVFGYRDFEEEVRNHV